MKEITIYEANDGSRFASRQECKIYEDRCAQVRVATQPIGERPKLESGCSIQHDRIAVHAVRNRLVSLAREWWPTERIWQYDANDIHPMGVAGRYADDSGVRCFYNAWHRLMCINFDNFREYDQPYFALNPDKAAA